MKKIYRLGFIINNDYKNMEQAYFYCERNC